MVYLYFFANSYLLKSLKEFESIFFIKKIELLCIIMFSKFKNFSFKFKFQIHFYFLILCPFFIICFFNCLIILILSYLFFFHQIRIFLIVVKFIPFNLFLAYFFFNNFIKLNKTHL